MPKMKGVVAQLVTTDDRGNRLESKFVFRPDCDWRITALRDELAESVFTDFSLITEEFGADVAQRIVDGEVVEVEREVPADLELVGCRRRDDPWVRTSFQIFGGGVQEDLGRRSIVERPAQLAKQEREESRFTFDPKGFGRDPFGRRTSSG